MNPAELSAAVLAAVAACLDSGEFDGTLPDEAHVERPKHREHGDYATNSALRLAKASGRPPREIAEAVDNKRGPGVLTLTAETSWHPHRRLIC